MTTTVRDMAGNALGTAKTWSFTTAAAADNTAPDTTIATGPSGRVSSTSATFTYTSTETGSSFACRLDAGALEPCLSGGRTYTGLTEGTHTFAVQATDAADNTDTSPATRTWTVDLTAPHVAEPTIPAGGASGVSVGTQVKATFSEEMAAATITAARFTLSSSSGAVDGSVTYDTASRTATFTSASALAATTSYTARIDPAVTDTAGNPMGTARSWTFTTGAPSAGTTLYRHNEPTPPSANTTAQRNMSMNGTAPTATTLYQSSTDFYTGGPGRAVEKSSPTATQADAKYMATWTRQFATTTAFTGSAELRVWVAMKDLKCDKTPSFTVYLREKTSQTTDTGTVLATATASSAPVGGQPCNFRLLTVTLPVSGTDVAAGNWLELKITVNESTGDSALLAYDTVTFAATLKLP